MRLFLLIFLLGCRTSQMCEYQQIEIKEHASGYGKIIKHPCGQSIEQINGEIYIKNEITNSI